MATPYITPSILINAATGISWETIPDFGADLSAQIAEQTNICWRATHWIDQYCGQVLRATVDTEELLSPDYRATTDYSTGNGRFIVSRFPVTSIESIRWTPTGTVPPQWTSVPVTAAFIEDASYLTQGISVGAGSGANAIQIAPGYVNTGTRRGSRVQLTYTNGWFHGGITVSAPAGSTTLTVDDCTGTTIFNQDNILAPVTAWIYDGENTEYVSIASATATHGPGTLTLSRPTTFAHNLINSSPIMISRLPATIQEAAILHSTQQALVRGATATTVQAMPGSVTGGGGMHPASLLDDAKSLLDPYRRVI